MEEVATLIIACEACMIDVFEDGEIVAVVAYDVDGSCSAQTSAAI